MTPHHAENGEDFLARARATANEGTPGTDQPLTRRELRAQERERQSRSTVAESAPLTRRERRRLEQVQAMAPVVVDEAETHDRDSSQRTARGTGLFDDLIRGDIKPAVGHTPSAVGSRALIADDSSAAPAPSPTDTAPALPSTDTADATEQPSNAAADAAASTAAASIHADTTGAILAGEAVEAAPDEESAVHDANFTDESPTDDMCVEDVHVDEAVRAPLTRRQRRALEREQARRSAHDGSTSGDDAANPATADPAPGSPPADSAGADSADPVAVEQSASDAEGAEATAASAPSRPPLRSRSLAKRRRPVTAATPAVVARRSEPSVRVSRLRRGILSMGVMGFVAAIALATSVPVLSGTDDYDVAAAESESEPAAASEALSAESEPAPTPETQSLSGDGATLAPIESDKYTSRTLDEVAEMYHIRTAATYTNDPNGDVQWPFPVGVPVSDFYGYRTDPVGFHHGVDFTPGVGSDIHAIADGTVSLVGLNPNDGLGIHVIIDHEIDGQQVSSVYAHMMPGTVQVTEGEQVSVTDVVGEVGSTGFSTGPHLHFEIRLGGSDRVDPFAWMQQHAN